MTTILKGDTTADMAFSLAEGLDLSGKTVHLEYQGVRRSFSGVCSGQTPAFRFTAGETAPMSLGAYPVRVWIVDDATGEVQTLHNTSVKFRLTNDASEVNGSGAVVLDVRGSLHGIDGLGEKWNENDLRGKINEIIRRLGGTVAIAALALLPVLGATLDVKSAPKGEIYNDQPVVTNVTLDVSDLATLDDLERAVPADYNIVKEQVEANAAEIEELASEVAAKADAVKSVGEDGWIARGVSRNITTGEVAYWRDVPFPAPGGWEALQYTTGGKWTIRFPVPDCEGFFEDYISAPEDAASLSYSSSGTIDGCSWSAMFVLTASSRQEYSVVYADALDAVTNAVLESAVELAQRQLAVTNDFLRLSGGTVTGAVAVATTYEFRPVPSRELTSYFMDGIMLDKVSFLKYPYGRSGTFALQDDVSQAVDNLDARPVTMPVSPAAHGVTFTDLYGENQNVAVEIGADAIAKVSTNALENAASNTVVRSTGIAIGAHAEVTNTRDPLKIQGVAIGWHSQVTGINGLAIGGGAQHPNETAMTGNATVAAADNAIALGYNAKACATNSVQIGSGVNTVNDSLQFRDVPIVQDGKLAFDDTATTNKAVQAALDEVIGRSYARGSFSTNVDEVGTYKQITFSWEQDNDEPQWRVRKYESDDVPVELGDMQIYTCQTTDAIIAAAANATLDSAAALARQEIAATVPDVVTNIVKDLSLGGIWDETLQVWWTPRMRNGSLTYEATTNVNLNATN